MISFVRRWPWDLNGGQDELLLMDISTCVGRRYLSFHYDRHALPAPSPCPLALLSSAKEKAEDYVRKSPSKKSSIETFRQRLGKENRLDLKRLGVDIYKNVAREGRQVDSLEAKSFCKNALQAPIKTNFHLKSIHNEPTERTYGSHVELSISNGRNSSTDRGPVHASTYRKCHRHPQSRKAVQCCSKPSFNFPKKINLISVISLCPLALVFPLSRFQPTESQSKSPARLSFPLLHPPSSINNNCKDN